MQGILITPKTITIAQESKTNYKLETIHKTYESFRKYTTIHEHTENI